MSTILAPDDLNIGQAVTILRGNETTCANGCCVAEDYAPLKGLPIVVMEINLPYVIGAVVSPQKTMAVIDLRLCELMRVSDTYVRTFQTMCGIVPIATGQPPAHGGESCVGK